MRILPHVYLSLLCVACCVGCSATPEEDALRLLESVGAKLRNNEQGQLISVDLSSGSASDLALAAIGEFPHVTTINCNGATRITGSGLAHLGRLTQLDTLYLANTSLDDAGLVHLSHLKTLKTLQLNGTKITDAGMPSLDHLTNLRTLSLANTVVTNHGLISLRDLRSLETISVRDTKVSREGTQDLQRMLPNARVVR